MKYIFERSLFSVTSNAMGYVKFRKATNYSDVYSVLEIGVDVTHKNWQMGLCHELAHVLLHHEKNKSEWGGLFGWSMEILRRELRAWRLAKSFCRPELWNDATAVEKFSSYIKHPDISDKIFEKIIKKLKIVEINKGVKK